MLNDIEEKRKNELLDKIDDRANKLSNAEYIELRSLTQKAISNLVFSSRAGA